MENLKEFLSSKGITPQNMGKAIIVHEVLGVTILMTAWAGCFLIKPSKHLINTLQLRRTDQWRRAETRMQSSRLVSLVRDNKYLSSNTASAVTIAFGESYFLRKLAMPVLVPLKFWLTYQIIKTTGKTIQE